MAVGREQQVSATILVSNDDGITAPGIAALESALIGLGEVFVIAPDRERSASSHSLTIDVPLRAVPVRERAFAVKGTPTDCVLLAVENLLPTRPDLVVSGINRGPNMGNDVTYSGTVAAAIEGTILGIPSMAVSLDHNKAGTYDYTAAGTASRALAAAVLERGLPEGTLLNVNVPNVPAEQVKAPRPTRLGSQVYEDSIVEKTDPRGKSYYWIGGQSSRRSCDSGTDFAVVAEGHVSVTPIQLDMTDFETLAHMADWPFDAIHDSRKGGGAAVEKSREESA
ncbi:MAG: 5'/3'-nucleotidase SurE [Candidatus Eisenbacteria bacterium]|nr:5'/3'-nucleotidase SurE [Candidatus Eisenbacteria bacterium]